MGVQTFKFASRSEDTEHTVTVGANGHLHCTCRGFKTPSRCWHVREVAEKLGLPQSARSNTPALEPLKFDFRPWEKRVEVVEGPADPNHFVEPMLGRALKETERLEQWCGRADWSLEEKYDGHRIQLHVMPDRTIVALSRDQNRRSLAAHLLNELSVLAAGVYDGELFVPGKSSTHVTRKDMFSRHRLALFDIIGVYDGSILTTTTDLQLHHRRKLLTQAMSRMRQLEVFQAPVYPVTTEQLQTIYDRGGEGVMLKYDHETYLPGRRQWIKFKKELHTRVTVTGFNAGEFGPHSVICSIDADGIPVRCKSLDTKMRTAFDQNPDIWIGRTLVIAYQLKTEKGKYRHPRADHFE